MKNCEGPPYPDQILEENGLIFESRNSLSSFLECFEFLADRADREVPSQALFEFPSEDSNSS